MVRKELIGTVSATVESHSLWTERAWKGGILDLADAFVQTKRSKAYIIKYLLAILGVAKRRETLITYRKRNISPSHQWRVFTVNLFT